jgi:hypothetical protein
MSVRRVSHNPTPDGIAALLRALLVGLDVLTQRYDVRICHYEDLRSLDPDYVNALLAWIGSDARISPSLAAELARRDAQAGSSVSRASVKDTPEDPGFRDAFRSEWARLRPTALIERLELERL